MEGFLIALVGVRASNPSNLKGFIAVICMEPLRFAVGHNSRDCTRAFMDKYSSCFRVSLKNS